MYHVAVVLGLHRKRAGYAVIALYIGDNFYGTLAAVVNVSGAGPSEIAGAIVQSKGGSHGENHDQSQSDCENLLHFFKSLSKICYCK